LAEKGCDPREISDYVDGEIACRLRSNVVAHGGCPWDDPYRQAEIRGHFSEIANDVYRAIVVDIGGPGSGPAITDGVRADVELQGVRKSIAVLIAQGNGPGNDTSDLLRAGAGVSHGYSGLRVRRFRALIAAVPPVAGEERKKEQ